jgi:hypothetical protein
MPVPKQLAEHVFQPGRSGNPGGRPRKRAVSDRYAELMESPLPEKIRRAMELPAGALWGDAIVLAGARTGLRSTEAGTSARKEIRESIEGKSTQRFEFAAGDADSRLAEFVVVYATAVPGAVDPKIIDVAPEQPELLEDPSREDKELV